MAWGRGKGSQVWPDRGSWQAEVHSECGKEIMENFADELIRIFPQRIVGWGMDSDAYERNSRSVG